ncbi:MAG: HlyD family secretion protein [Acidobacteria bacterium]|nr:HlyD family secretion protein [Acidobacteriota bacterium]
MNESSTPGRSRKKIVILSGAVAFAVLALAWVYNGRVVRSAQLHFTTSPADRVDITMGVGATGTLHPVVRVLVGSQVSGRIWKLNADFNSQVRRGQVIAELDPSTFNANLLQAEANLKDAEAGVKANQASIENARANLETTKANRERFRVEMENAQRNHKRALEMFEQGLIPEQQRDAAQAEYDRSRAQLEAADAQLEQAQAQIKSMLSQAEQAKARVSQANASLELARVNLSHTIIKSPIDGIVISRDVDVGQTVAASLQAPTLFTIANDLTKMQVETNIDEADVGRVQVGQPATFTVDAFAGEHFVGEVAQVRLSPITVQNVVTYTAILSVDNPDLRLRPGMTATVNIQVAHRSGALRIPNAALRFRPPEEILARAKLPEGRPQEPGTFAEPRERRRQEGAWRGERPRPGGAAGGRGQDRWRAGDPPERGHLRTHPGAGPIRPTTLWALNPKTQQIEPRQALLGISDGNFTEVVRGEVKEGDLIVTGSGGEGAEANSQSAQRPFFLPQWRGPGGGGPRR